MHLISRADALLSSNAERYLALGYLLCFGKYQVQESLRYPGHICNYNVILDSWLNGKICQVLTSPIFMG